MNCKSIISALAMTVAGAVFADASEMAYSYAGSDVYYQWGAKIAQNYDVAVKLEASAFGGCKITSVSVPVVSTDKTAGYSVWLSSELTLGQVDGKKVNVSDITSVDVAPQGVVESIGFIEYTFPEPFEITADVFVGYSFAVSGTASDFDRYPVLIAAGAQPDGFYVHSSKTYRQWQDRSEEIGCVSPIRVVLEGDFKAHAVSLDAVGDFAVQAGEVSKRAVTIHNLGSNPVASIGYEITVDGNVSEGVFQFDEPLEAVYNRKGSATVDVPSLSVGAHEYSLRITKVNGSDNGTLAECSGVVNAFDVLPVKRPLMEEFTGTWCGWCPRGWVAMEMMNAMYPDFVCISYHDSDLMMLPSGYPEMMRGFPDAMMDRSLNCDPYYGSPERDFGIQQTWLAMSKMFTPAALTLKAEYNAEDNTVSVTSDVFWAEAPEDGEYKVEYVLVGNGIYSESLLQHNYYATANPSSYSPELGQFCSGGQYGQSDVAITFNDVALITSGLTGVEGSVASTAVGTHNTYTHTFNVEDSRIAPLCKDFHVVAMLLKSGGAYGKVVNSNKCEIKGLSGIGTVIAGEAATVESVRYFDLSGREISAPAAGVSPVGAGLCIKQVKYTDGTTATTKILR